MLSGVKQFEFVKGRGGRGRRGRMCVQRPQSEKYVREEASRNRVTGCWWGWQIRGQEGQEPSRPDDKGKQCMAAAPQSKVVPRSCEQIQASSPEQQPQMCTTARYTKNKEEGVRAHPNHKTRGWGVPIEPEHQHVSTRKARWCVGMWGCWGVGMLPCRHVVVRTGATGTL